MSIPYFLEAQMKLNETCRLLIEEHGFVFRPWGGSIGSVWSLRAGEFSGIHLYGELEGYSLVQ